MKILVDMMRMVDNQLIDSITHYANEIDFISIAEKLIESEDVENIERLLKISQYIETDTKLESIIPDETYDILHAIYKKQTGKSIVGTSTRTETRLTKPHTYTELRGTLDKVHFLVDEEKPYRDSRESLDHWLNKSLNRAGAEPGKVMEVSIMYKYDGLSSVFEYENGELKNVLSRKDTDENIGVDITHVFGHDYKIPGLENFIHNIPKFGVQTEVIMTYDNFKRFGDTLTEKPKNHRSAVSKILNTSIEEFNPEYFQYLTVVPLKIAIDDQYIKYADEPVQDIRYSNSVTFPYDAPNYIIIPSDHYELIGRTIFNLIDKGDKNSFIISSVTYQQLIDLVKANKDLMRRHAEACGIPIDGIVISFCDRELISELGRKDSVNKFQVAFKFPAGIVKTIVKDVEYLVGNLGTVTPRAKVEPIVIMGNTVTYVTVSNFNKLKRLHLHEGDEIYIKYDIVPTILKDDTCKEGVGQVYQTPIVCPVCGHALEISEDESVVRCINDDCPSRIVGKIYNYIDKMNIEGIGLSTVESLHNNGLLNDILDLYQLPKYKNQIIALPGFGEVMYDNMLNAINNRIEVYPHELLGSLGILNVSKKTFEKVCKYYTIDDLLTMDEYQYSELYKIKGIGMITGTKIYVGIQRNKHIIAALLRYIKIKLKDYSDDKLPKLLFTGVRDKEFEKYLKDNGLAEVVDNYSKAVDYVVVLDDDTHTTKVEKALKDGKVIITLEEAYEKFK